MVLWYIQFMLKWYYGIVVFNIFLLSLHSENKPQ